MSAKKKAAPAIVKPTVVVEPTVVVKTKKPRRIFSQYKNKPWQKKFYHLDVDAYAAADLTKQPNQLKLILKWMSENHITDADASMQGGTIVQRMKDAGLQTKIDAPVLFAYYRSTMEAFGLVFTGYDISHD